FAPTKRESRTSVQDATAAVNVELHRHFDRAGSSRFKPPLQKSFGGQFVQFFVAGAVQDFDFINLAALRIYGEPKTTFALRAVRLESNWILGFDFFDSSGRRFGCYVGFQSGAPLRLGGDPAIY